MSIIMIGLCLTHASNCVCQADSAAASEVASEATSEASASLLQERERRPAHNTQVLRVQKALQVCTLLAGLSRSFPTMMFGWCMTVADVADMLFRKRSALDVWLVH